jgi:hypothetical protein
VNTAVATVLVGVVALLGAGCDAATEQPAAPRRTPASLGGEHHDRVRAPDTPMSRLERAIAERLTDQLHEQDLSVAHLDCPAGADAAPTAMVCQAYVEGVAVDVDVALHGHRPGITFDARLGPGLLATASLVQRLRDAGYDRVDCGSREAYPAVVGDRIVCAVQRDGRRRYVVATVTTADGHVAISDYRAR